MIYEHFIVQGKGKTTDTKKKAQPVDASVDMEAASEQFAKL